MATGTFPAVGTWRRIGTASNGTETTITFPEASTYLMFTGHNSTANLNTLWLIRAGAGAGDGAYLLAVGARGTSPGTASAVTVTGLGNRQFKLLPTGGSITIDIQKV